MRTERIELIEQYIIDHKNVSLDTLCEVFQVSKNTIRRDIGQLNKRGSIKKVYGGVTAAAPDTNYITITPFNDRSNVLDAEKQAICQYAASLIEDNDIIFIDTGTTSQYLVDYIARKHCIIITNSLKLSLKAVSYPNLTIISLPGELNRDTLSFVGSEAEFYLAKYNINKAFLCCTGVSIENGLTNATTEEYLVKKAVIQNCKAKILMADHTKFDKFTLMTYCDLADIQQIITDRRPAPEYVDYCREHGIILSEAEPS